MPAMDPKPETIASPVLELKSAAQSDQVCVHQQFPTSVPVGVLVELDKDVCGHSYPQASEL